MSGGICGLKFDCFFQWRNGLRIFLLSKQCHAQPKVGIGKIRIELGGLGEVLYRPRQVLGLLKDQISMNVRVRETDLRLEHRGNGDGSSESSCGEAAPAAVPEVVSRGPLLWLSRRPSRRILSIILPVKNGEAKLGALLPAIASQRSHDPIEIVAVACAPFFGPALWRSAAVSTVVM